MSAEHITAKIIDYDGMELRLEPSEHIGRDIMRKQAGIVEIRLVDGRSISGIQRNKAYAIIRDIADWYCDVIPYVRDLMKYLFIVENESEIEWFSLSDTDMTTARLFIDFLIRICLEHGIPTRKPLSEMTDDVGRYLYMCLEYRKCAVCGREAETHHVDRIGMGRNRNEMCHIGMSAIALCREHHDMAHTDEKKLFENNHVYGIKLDRYLVKKLQLGVS
jgi:hypothetical protein